MAIYKGNQKIDGGYPIATSITSSSTNDEVAGAKAVYDAIPKITISNVDLTPRS